jgi:hypothetical protein
MAATQFLLLGVGLVAVVWASATRLHRRFEYGVLAFVAAVLVLYAITPRRMDMYLGILAVPSVVQFAGPFVNPNHFGSFLLLAVPLLMFRATEGGMSSLVYGTILAAAVGASVLVGSVGPVAVMGIQAFVVVAYVSRSWVLSALLSASALLASVSALWSGRVDWSLHDRIHVWRWSMSLLADHWLLGIGGGAYRDAIEPYRQDQEFHRWNHAHNDWLEWCVETGLFGTVAIVLALVLALKRLRTSSDTARMMLLGVGGVLLHSGVDFPLRTPAIAICSVFVLGWVAATHTHSPPVSARRVRLLVAGLAVLQVPLAGWNTYEAIVDHRLRTFLREPSKHTAEALEAVAPTSIALTRFRLQQLSDPHAVRATVTDLLEAYPRSADAHRIGAIAALKTDDREQARELSKRATLLSPADFRNWLLHARIVERVAPEASVDTWATVILRRPHSHAAERRLLESCWTSMPLGLFWVDAVSDAPRDVRQRVARMLRQHDATDALLLLHSEARFDGLELPGYAALLMEAGNDADAEALLREQLEQDDSGESAVELATLLFEQERFHEVVQLLSTGHRRGPEGRMLLHRARAASLGEEVALRHLRLDESSGRSLDVRELYLKATFEASLGLRDACFKTLSDPRLEVQSEKVQRARGRCGRTR